MASKAASFYMMKLLYGKECITNKSSAIGRTQWDVSGDVQAKKPEIYMSLSFAFCYGLF